MRVCRANPPQVVDGLRRLVHGQGKETMLGVWPETHKDEVCGDYRAK